MTSGPGPVPVARTVARVLSRTVAPFAVTLLMLATGCHLLGGRPQHPEPPLGHWYVVESGETLADIARRAGVPEEDLLEVNGFHSAADAYPGKMIFVLFGPGSHPDAVDARTPPGAAPVATGPSPSSTPSAEPQRKGPKARFRWPVDSPRVTSLFGSRWGRPHEGIDLQAAIGTPVYAADEGEIVYAGNTVRGYGNMVVIKHPDELLTVYAHNSVLLVKVGERVASGQRIALSGQSGHATGPHVHFEVRRAQVPRDPLQFLSGRNSKP